MGVSEALYEQTWLHPIIGAGGLSIPWALAPEPALVQEPCRFLLREGEPIFGSDKAHGGGGRGPASPSLLRHARCTHSVRAAVNTSIFAREGIWHRAGPWDSGR